MTGEVSNDLKAIYPVLRYISWLIMPEAAGLLLYHTSLRIRHQVQNLRNVTSAGK